MIFKRSIEQHIEDYLKGDSYKTLFIWGPRRSGKTTLLKQLSEQLAVSIFDFDLQTDRELFVPRREILDSLVATHNVILIDEVQNYPQATVVLKILYDLFKVKVIATGSSELRQKAGADFDSMTGRFIEEYCLPLSIYEIAENKKIAPLKKEQFSKNLQKDIQIFGSYPEVYAETQLTDTGKAALLGKILDTYVLKDIISLYDLKNEKLAKDILTKIALQLGSEVSVREIAASLGANKDTVANYIEIFVKNYILIPLPSFRTNIRKAVSENRKLYFYDLGIRNALIKDFRETELRPDQGGLFENFIISEIEKQRKNNGVLCNLYFYREYGGKEVDLVIEDYKKNYTVLEIKVDKGIVRDVFPLPHTSELVNMQNYFEKIDKALKYL